MYSIQMDGTFQQFIQIFYRMGIWQNDDESYYRKIGKKCFYTFFGALLPIFYLIDAFLCSDRSESIFSVQAAIMTTVIYVKLLYLLSRKQEILELFSEYENKNCLA